MTEFPLPTLTQDQFSSFYGTKIPRDDSIEESIVYPGIKLLISSRSRSIKRDICSENVFISKWVDADGNIHFNHRLYGNDNVWTILPKRLHSVCFPKIHLGSIPQSNRVRLQLTDSIFEVLPYVPDDFYKQKQQKAERPSKPLTRRTKRSRQVNIPASDPTETYTGWHVHLNNQVSKNEPSNKESILAKIRSMVDQIDCDKMVVAKPFERLDTDEDIERFTTIVKFVYHYGRGEFRMCKESTAVETDLWEKIKKKIN